MQNLQTSQGYIFRILQPFGTKLCNSTNLRMLFLAVVNDFVLFELLVHLNLNRLLVHYANCPLNPEYENDCCVMLYFELLFPLFLFCIVVLCTIFKKNHKNRPEFSVSWLLRCFDCLQESEQ